MRAIQVVAIVAVSASAFAAPPVQKEDGWVVLPAADYQALRAKARAKPEPPPPSPPPVPVTLTRVDYDLKAGTDLASGEVRLTADVFAEGWIRLPLPAGLRVARAWLDARPIAILRGAESKVADAAVLLGRPGRAVVRLEIAVPLASSAGEESLTLPSSPSGTTRAQLSMSSSGVDVRASGGLVTERHEAATGSRFVAHASSGSPLTLTWGRRREARSSLPLRWRGSLTHLVGLAEDSAQVSVEVGLEVLQGVLPSVRLGLPEGFSVNEVKGPGVADWDVKAGILGVTFLDPVATAATLTVTGEAPAPRQGQVRIPLLRLPEVERESGGVAVEVLGSGQIEAQEPRGVEPADPGELGGAVARRDAPSLVAYRYRPGNGTLPRSLVVEVARYTAAEVLETNLEEARYEALVTEDGKLLVRARYAIRNTQRSFLAISLPQGAVLWSAAVSGRPVRPGEASGAALLLPLQKAKAGEDPAPFAVEVVYLDHVAAWGNDGRVRLSLPAVDLPVGRAGLDFYHPSRFRLQPEPGVFRAEGYRAPSSPAFQERPPSPPPPPAAPAPKAVAKSASGALGMAGAPPPERPEDVSATLMATETQGEELRALADRFQREGRGGSRVAGVLPVRVPFPAFGPALFLASELQAEGQAPAVELQYRKEKR
jgi:hypothetical protein